MNFLLDFDFNADFEVDDELDLDLNLVNGSDRDLNLIGY